MGIEQAQIF